MKKPRTADLKPLLDAGYELIPLNRPFHKRRDRRGVMREAGKAPLDARWTSKRYDSAKTVKKYGGVHNIGVKLGPTDLVLDVDVRHDGAKGLKKFRAAFPEWDYDAQPKVVTGAGGIHVYTKIPEGFRPVETLPEFPGIEFKIMGRQVVAPGSIHPQTKKFYHWKDGSPDVSEAQPLPKGIRKKIKRPPPPKNAPDAGGVEPDALAEMLSYLDPAEYGSNEAWLPIMMACHHATAGEGRQEFIDWSTSDPAYADNDIEIGARWDSCDPGKADGVTQRTLFKALREAGCPGRLIPGSGEAAADEFSDLAALEELDGDAPEEDDGELDTSENDIDEDDKDNAAADLDAEFEAADEERESSARDLLQELNATHSMVMTGNRTRIFRKKFEPLRERTEWDIIPPQDFKVFYDNQKIEENGKPKGIGSAWVTWAARNTKKGVVFQPNGAPDGYLNLWTGWGVEQKKTGSWDRLREMIFEVLCKGDDDRYQYVMNWCARMVQFPDQPGGTAITITGGKGVGKSTLGRTLVKLSGDHGLHISSSEHLTGRFNNHLRNVLCLFSDEAVRSGDHAANARLKALITEPTLTYEAKGVDPSDGPNYCHLFIASNEKFVVEASQDERRYFVMEASDKWQGKITLWDKLNKQLREGGYERLLYDLMHWEIPQDWHSYASMPMTEELFRQKLAGLSSVHKWFYHMAEGGVLTMKRADDPENSNWDSSVEVFKADVRESWAQFCKENRINHGASQGQSLDMFLFQSLAEILPGADKTIWLDVGDDRRNEIEFLRGDTKTGRAQAIEIPSLRDCYKGLKKFLGADLPFVAEQEAESDDL